MQAISFLLIEDDVIETMKFQRVLSAISDLHTVKQVNNGEEALEALTDHANLPNVILLDLNMPKMNGIEFLKILKADPVLQFIPTVILSTSNNSKDIHKCYHIGIAGYVMKPLKYEEYKTKINALINYWSENEFAKLK